MKPKTESFRIGKEILEKIRAIARAEGRTIQGQIERMLAAALDAEPGPVPEPGHVPGGVDLGR